MGANASASVFEFDVVPESDNGSPTESHFSTTFNDIIRHYYLEVSNSNRACCILTGSSAVMYFLCYFQAMFKARKPRGITKKWLHQITEYIGKFVPGDVDFCVSYSCGHLNMLSNVHDDNDGVDVNNGADEFPVEIHSIPVSNINRELRIDLILQKSAIEYYVIDGVPVIIPTALKSMYKDDRDLKCRREKNDALKIEILDVIETIFDRYIDYDIMSFNPRSMSILNAKTMLGSNVGQSKPALNFDEFVKLIQTSSSIHSTTTTTTTISTVRSQTPNASTSRNRLFRTDLHSSSVAETLDSRTESPTTIKRILRDSASSPPKSPNISIPLALFNPIG